ncbi:phosphoribosylglycinamide synthetase [Bifidobacterium dolichotidis]|nr:phosphoribosylglycinamide synthetase [Bifidobacterium dolichotidis]
MSNPMIGLKIAAERLSIVRYVFLVSVEDGIASAAQRASLEYSDAVLIGWPEMDSAQVVEPTEAQLVTMRELMRQLERGIARFSREEADRDVDGMTNTLVSITHRVAEMRRIYEPSFPLPTFAEIRRVVQAEWDEDMGKIDTGESEAEPTVQGALDMGGDADAAPTLSETLEQEIRSEDQQ